MHWNFQKDRPYFVLDPEGDGVSCFETIEERDKYAEKRIQEYLDYTWSEEVVNVVAGVVTHSAQQTDFEDRRTAQVDDEGYDKDGIYWDPDFEYKCNYQLLLVGDTEKDDALSCVAINPMVRSFGLIRTAAEAAIAEAKTIRGEFEDAINWADLRCVRVCHWTDDTGDSGYTAEIEEASPGALEFRRWIEESIENDIGIIVEVITEW